MNPLRPAILAQRIRQYRGSYGWTQKQLAVEAGIAWSTVNWLERGKIKRPKPGTLKKLAEALDIPSDLFFSLEKEVRYLDERLGKITNLFQRCSVSDQENLIDFATILAEKNERLKDI